jgi:pyruvate,orthophosphate dikinase
MAGLPATIRLLDPPLHEFLPHGDNEFAELSEAIGIGVETLKRRAGSMSSTPCWPSRLPPRHHLPRNLRDAGPRHLRGRHGRGAESGEAIVPEVMIPLVATKRELEILKLIDRTAATVFEEKGKTLDYLVGTMIELPRAALMAGEIAEEARFFSFGTNDLTQTTLGISRDDAARFLGAYVDQGIYPRDPFVSLDIEGVGQLVSLAAERGRKTRPDIKLGICGEHGGDPASIAFCEATGWITSRPRRSVCRLPGWRRLRRRSGVKGSCEGLPLALPTSSDTKVGGIQRLRNLSTGTKRRRRQECLGAFSRLKACGAATLALWPNPVRDVDIKGARGRWPSHFLF